MVCGEKRGKVLPHGQFTGTFDETDEGNSKTTLPSLDTRVLVGESRDIGTTLGVRRTEIRLCFCETWVVPFSIYLEVDLCLRPLLPPGWAGTKGAFPSVIMTGLCPHDLRWIWLSTRRTSPVFGVPSVRIQFRTQHGCYHKTGLDCFNLSFIKYPVSNQGV